MVRRESHSEQGWANPARSETSLRTSDTQVVRIVSFYPYCRTFNSGRVLFAGIFVSPETIAGKISDLAHLWKAAKTDGRSRRFTPCFQGNLKVRARSERAQCAAHRSKGERIMEEIQLVGFEIQKREYKKRKHLLRLPHQMFHKSTTTRPNILLAPQTHRLRRVFHAAFLMLPVSTVSPNSFQAAQPPSSSITLNPLRANFRHAFVARWHC